jgi:hypothetical protein
MAPRFGFGAGAGAGLAGRQPAVLDHEAAGRLLRLGALDPADAADGPGESHGRSFMNLRRAAPRRRNGG